MRCVCIYVLWGLMIRADCGIRLGFWELKDFLIEFLRLRKN